MRKQLLNQQTPKPNLKCNPFSFFLKIKKIKKKKKEKRKKENLFEWLVRVAPHYSVTASRSDGSVQRKASSWHMLKNLILGMADMLDL